MTYFLISRQWRELAILLLLIIVTTPIFWLTDWDQRVSAWFFRAENGGLWLGQQWAWCRWLFAYAPRIFVSFAVLALLLVGLSYSKPNLRQFRRPAVYFIGVMLLGPGLLVNLVFKDHWGRPRPIHIQTFNGAYTYVPPLKLGYTKDKSFSCGHCSAAFSFFALYFLTRRHKRFYLLVTLSAGILMGFVRLSAGGHFLSDVLWSGYVVFLTAWLLYYGWYIRAIATK